MLSLLSATTPSGRLYSIDARLRPNGRAGLLVSSVEAFNRYQSEEAWVWELQALTRARPVGGSTEIAENFTMIRQQVLTSSRDQDFIRRELTAMRERIRTQHSDGAALKHDPGGLLDIEFIVQLGLLLNAQEFPVILRSTALSQQLLALLDCGWIKPNAFKILDSAYMQLSQARQQATLMDDRAEVETTGLLNIARALCDGILR